MFDLCLTHVTTIFAASIFSMTLIEKNLLVIRVRITVTFNRSNSTIVGSTNYFYQENTFDIVDTAEDL